MILTTVYITKSTLFTVIEYIQQVKTLKTTCITKKLNILNNFYNKFDSYRFVKIADFKNFVEIEI